MAFDGTLLVALANGFAPASGSSFDLFNWATTSGTFDTLTLPDLNAGLTWDTSQLYSSGVLRVVAAVGIPGDYNQNGVVDAPDFAVWRDTVGSTTHLAADGNGNMMIDAGDYAVWKMNFGTIASGTGSSALWVVAPVPEPNSIVLLIVAVVPLAKTLARNFALWVYAAERTCFN
jgi:hypothetical protein